MKVRWSLLTTQTLRRALSDQEGVHAVTAALARLADDPTPPEALPYGRDGDYRLRIGRYRVMYRIEDEVITLGRVDRLPD
ncbi:type II toxin-antitoxin system RelE family toxin [Actinomadura macrotermitis]|uniref:Type II toxin-antitoxin system RelE/ParE family toxin n=1 Tax=Actinomadura macrotermitis TaxID=2585200 RepID=A0A7K0C1S3_9ACTN|nr:type II toxin-antitoxin system RelE/ParE family toxin [Actinomadura macrotermitis]MQY07032.1 hypothetical protein [Actinomadura macrotermitis]